jgi:hypothetical protein
MIMIARRSQIEKALINALPLILPSLSNVTIEALGRSFTSCGESGEPCCDMASCFERECDCEENQKRFTPEVGEGEDDELPVGTVEKFWMVRVEDAGPPTLKHKSLSDACLEAARLCETTKKPAVVLEAVAAYEAVTVATAVEFADIPF